MGRCPRRHASGGLAEELEIRLEETVFAWHEVLGVSADADAATTQRAMRRLALSYHPDTGGNQEQMARINAAYETACSRDDQ